MGIPIACQPGIPTIPVSGISWENPPMAELAEILPSRIRERLEKTGKSMRAVSVAIGANTGYVRDLLDPDRFNVPSSARLHALAKALETSTEYLLGEAASPDQLKSEVSIGAGEIDFDRDRNASEPIPLMGTGDCADLSVTDDQGREVAIERSSFDPDFHVRYIRRPAMLAGRRGVYAIYFHGSSMEPRFYAGEVGLVDPNRPPGPGEYVLVQLNSGDSDEVVSVLVKKLVRRNAQEIVLEQYNPALTFTLPLSKVQRVHRIMPQTELLFG
ncbi:SOS-response transcriptional repressor LexA [Erythrobacter lutimaris]|nr:SOS-response transcriptional repressor LexA [Alteriqipengyuania lutimaris]